MLVGCAGLYSGVVTVTKVRDSAMKELAQLNKQGKISAATDTKIAAADLAYRQAAEVATKALEEYKVSGDKTKYIQALQTVKVAVTAILDILTPMISQSQSAEYQTQLLKAVNL